MTQDLPPFRFLSSSCPLTVMVLPERLPVISGLKSRTSSPTHLGYLPGDKVSINCSSAPSHPAASLVWSLNRRRADRWMVTSYVPKIGSDGLQSSVLGLSFLVLAEHFRGEEREVWATCKASLPTVQGIRSYSKERTLLLGSLSDRRSNRGEVQGGWRSRGVARQIGRELLLFLAIPLL